MRFDKILVPALVAFVGALPAQQYVLRGELELNAAGDYHLAGTTWPAKLNKALPDDYRGETLRMIAANLGTQDGPVLRVDDYTLVDPQLALSDFAVGKKAVGRVQARLGNYVVVAFGCADEVMWRALFGSDYEQPVWMLGAPVGYVAGFADAVVTRPAGTIIPAPPAEYVFSIALPADPLYCGERYVAQAMIFDGGGFETVEFSNPVFRTIK